MRDTYGRGAIVILLTLQLSQNLYMSLWRQCLYVKDTEKQPTSSSLIKRSPLLVIERNSSLTFCDRLLCETNRIGAMSRHRGRNLL